MIQSETNVKTYEYLNFTCFLAQTHTDSWFTQLLITPRSNEAFWHTQSWQTEWTRVTSKENRTYSIVYVHNVAVLSEVKGL